MEIQRLTALVDLLMAASAQDGSIDSEELGVIQGYLEEMGLLDEESRGDLDAYMQDFDIDQFDFEATIANLGEVDAEERGAVISLLEMVEEADGVIDLGESDFISKVATALGASADEVDALSLELMDASGETAAVPPPLPPGPSPDAGSDDADEGESDAGEPDASDEDSAAGASDDSASDDAGDDADAESGGDDSDDESGGDDSDDESGGDDA